MYNKAKQENDVVYKIGERVYGFNGDLDNWAKTNNADFVVQVNNQGFYCGRRVTVYPHKRDIVLDRSNES